MLERAARHGDRDAALGVAFACGVEALDRGERLARAAALLDGWRDDPLVLGTLGQMSEAWVDRRYLNAAAPSEPLFGALVQALRDRLARADDDGDRLVLARGLSVAGRVAGRAWDEACEAAFDVVMALEPDRWVHHYNLGLFFKVRGRFAEGLDANLRAEALCPERDDAVLWNLGICATGAGRGDIALARWRAIGCDVASGDDGLPVGAFPPMQVRLAERPVAEREAASDDPGREETVWVERYSPCHGRIRSALVQDLGVDYGDVVLFDGAPITERVVEGYAVPVHPHLATLRRGGWRTVGFAATQEAPGQVARVGERLGAGSFLYVHTEQVRTVCARCWERGEPHQHAPQPRRVVSGKLVMPPGAGAREVARALDREAGSAVRILVPDLWEEAGDPDHAAVERRRMTVLLGG